MSERMSTFEELQKAHTELKQIFDAAADGISVIDKDCTILRVNRNFYTLFGLGKEEVVGKKCYEIAASPYCRTRLCPLQQILAGEECVECEVEKDIYNGTKVPCIVTVTAYRDPGGNVIGAVQNFKNISLRKGMEEALRDSEERFRSAFDDAAVGMVITGIDGRFVRVNRAYCDMLGYNEEECLSMRFHDLTHPDDLDRDLALVGKTISGEIHTFQMEKRYIHKSGRLVWALLSVSLVKDVHGNPAYFVGQLQDITERKAAEQALQGNQKQLELIVNGISDVVYLLGAEPGPRFRILMANDSMATLLGLPREQLVGKTHEDVFPASEAARFNELFQQGVDAEGLISFEETWRGLVFDIKVIPILDDRGKCSLMIVTARDVTEKKKREEDFMKMEKLESLGVLAGGLAHDFNNILTVIMGNITLAKAYLDSMDKDNALRLMNEAEKATVQSKDLTLQLLTFAKGGAPIMKTAPIGDLLRGTAAFALSGSNVKCDFTIAENLWPVEMDEGQVSQVIQNIVINADQSMPGGGTIRISAENVIISGGDKISLPDGEYVKISVVDQGIGIPEEHLPKIFDPYFTTKQRGNGLGLATAYSVVKKHNGYITVDSKLGKGTSFCIYLPASHNEIPAQQKEASPALDGKGRVLVMDDEKMLRFVVGEMLAHIGYESGFARDGAEAIKIYLEAREAGQPFDAVIMDLTIPGGMGGKEAVQKLKEIDPGAKTIVSSGYYNDPVMANYKEYGFNGVIGKPYRIEQLSEVLQSVIKEGSQ